MLNLYIFDYYHRSSSGLTTYIDQLIDFINAEDTIILHFVWVAANNRYKENVKIIDRDGVVNYYVAHDLAKPDHSRHDESFVDLLVANVDEKQNNLFHFNWINHAPFAQYLKHKIKCVTVLTKHCIPWRDLITSNYPLFVHLNNQLHATDVIPYLNRALHHEWLAYNSVDHIICVTDLAKRSLNRLFNVDKKKITVIRNGINVNDKELVKSTELKKKYGFSDDERIILYAGAINQRKGVVDLIQVFNMLCKENGNVRLILAGVGDYAMVLKNAENNWSRITLTGVLNKQILYDFYQLADVGVVPSYVEQCSYTVIEMMHFGLPLVVTAVDGLIELVKDNFGRHTPLTLGGERASVDTDKFETAIENALKFEKNTSSMARNAQIYAKDKLTAIAMGSQTTALFESFFYKNTNKESCISALKYHPLVSVVIPCYNGAKYLKDCIDSVFNQSYDNIEVIIVDDGSNDLSSDIVKEYTDPRIKLIHNEHNTGIVSTLNRGIRIAKGKYIARIDCDDLMHRDRIIRQVEYFEQGSSQEVALVGSHHYVIDGAGRLIGMKQYPIENDEIKNTLVFQNPFSHPSVMIRAEVFKNIEYSDEYPHAEDYHLWFKILRQYKAGNIPEYLTSYRIHQSNISLTKSSEQRNSVAMLLSCELDRINVPYTSEELKLHLGISLGIGRRLFNTPVKVRSLVNWIDKVLIGNEEGEDSAISKLLVKDRIMRLYCDIN